MAAVICQREVMRDSLVWDVLICSAPCITVDICLMWGLSLHLGRTLCSSLVSRCLGRGTVYIFLWRCRSEVRRCTLHRRGRRVSTVNHHRCGGTRLCPQAPMLPPVLRATWCLTSYVPAMGNVRSTARWGGDSSMSIMSSPAKAETPPSFFFQQTKLLDKLLELG